MKKIPHTEWRPKSLSIRDRLLAIFLIVALPLGALQIYGTARDSEALMAEARSGARGLALSVAREHTQVLSGVKDVLRTIALAPEVRSGGSQECFFAMRDFVLEFQRFTALARVEPTGEISCSSIPEGVGISQNDQPFFQRALREGKFVVSRYMVGRLSGNPTVGMLYPVLDPHLDVEFLVYAGLELDWLADVLEGVEAPPETELTILDSQGIVIASYPRAGEWIGQPFPDQNVVSALTQAMTNADGRGLDGQSRLHGFARLGGGTEGGVVSVSRPQSLVSQPTEDALRRDIMIIIGVFLLGMTLAAMVADRHILKPLRVLTAAVRRIRAGDFKRYIGVGLGGEFDELAGAFNDMARRLQDDAKD